MVCFGLVWFGSVEFSWIGLGQGVMSFAKAVMTIDLSWFDWWNSVAHCLGLDNIPNIDLAELDRAELIG